MRNAELEGYSERNEMGNIIEEKSFDFAVRIVKLCKYLKTKKKETVLSKQLLRCGTSVGANVFEAQKAQTTADFYTKMTIALKEANETSYWIRLLYKTEYLTQNEFESIYNDIDEICSILVSITKTTKESLNNK
jgi:four helix bundle protein